MLHQEWAEFFPNSELGTNYSKKIQKLSSEDQNYYISFCNFGTLLTEGAINFMTSKNTTKTLIEASNFNNCTNTKRRGGILYFSTEGECVQNRICSLKSNSAYRYMYCYVDVSEFGAYKNKILNSLISESGNLYNYTHDNIYLKNGEAEINSINISYNNLEYLNLLSISDYYSSSRASFSTLINNTDTLQKNYDRFAYISYSQKTFLIKSCNYLSNNLIVIIGASMANFKLVNCSFINNTGRYFYIAQYTYPDASYESQHSIIDGCYIDESIPYSWDVYFTNNEANPFKIEYPNLTCEFVIPEPKNEEETEIIYVNRKKINFKNLPFLFFQSFVIISLSK